LLRDQGRIPHGAVARNDPGRLQRLELIEDLQPRGATRLCAEGQEPLAHHDVAGKQHPVLVHEHDGVPAGVGGPERAQCYRDAAEIEAVLGVEQHVRLAELDVSQQLRVEGCHARELLHHPRAELLDVLLLDLGNDELSPRGQRGRAAGMLGMEMGRNQVEIRVLADLGGFAQHRFHVARAKAGVDDQGDLRADDDPDVRHQADVAVRDHVHVVGDLDRGVLLDERGYRGRGRLGVCRARDGGG
jgi:hypothetical protein